MGIKFAVSFGAEVTVFSTTPSKEQDAKRLGAHHFVNTKDEEALKKVNGTFDFILDTVSGSHPLYFNALKSEGVLAVVGAPPEPVQISTFGLIMGNKVLAGT
jgi:uncharacterized zinc-type alcohol dehydrogenase-like protein